jgi:hypothetical protein
VIVCHLVSDFALLGAAINTLLPKRGDVPALVPDWSMSASANYVLIDQLRRAGDRQNVYLQSNTNAETFCLQ